MAVYISGSLAYDRIMVFSGAFREHLLPENLHILNVCFLVDGVEVKRGGTAGNIAHTLALLGERGHILSSAGGRDFDLYKAALKKKKLPLEGIRVVPDEFTASAFIITDRNNNQITAFSPSAMRFSCGRDFAAPDGTKDIALIGPGNREDMTELPGFFRGRGVRYIYDPGQQIPALSGGELLEAVEGAFICICNDYERELIGARTGLSARELGKRARWFITTFGEAGSEVEGEETARIGVSEVSRVVDPTGAGDAYRAGLLKGLTAGLGVPEAARVGAVCAAFCVECSGTQEHGFTKKSFRARYERAFGKLPAGIF
jgi:adenosine kinase